ncbi:MAG: glycosyl hydrolase [Candidatus Omnitrophota bacterium]
MTKQEFKEPGDRYRPVPFWFWNFYLDDEVIKFQIKQMKEAGLTGFFIHARHGLNIPYLGESWMQKCLIAITEAEKLGMQAWIYDEDNWPSGTTSGRVIREHPEYLASFITAKDVNLSGPKKVVLEIEPEDGLFLLLALKRTEEDKLSGFPGDAIDLKPHLVGKRLKWQVPAGNWKIITITRRVYRNLIWGGEEKNVRRGYLDVLNEKAVRCFIETTHQKYVERFEKYIPAVIPGFFVDEPSMNYSNTNDYNWNHARLKAVPFTPGLAEKFLRVAGYDFLTVLPGLFYDVGKETAKIRCDYYETITTLYSENFFRQIHDYCQAHKLLSVGHVIAEGELFMQVRNQGDYFRVTEHMHYAGCDQLADQTWPAGLFHTNNLAAPKFASSAGHLLNKPRVMSEAYGLAGGWGLTLKTLKKLTDWQVALGVNFFVPHAFYHSIFGFRKWECPPSHYQTTFWKYYRIYADYVARLCSVFSGGRHVAKVAVLSPVKSIWSQMDPDDSPLINKICEEFDWVSGFLLRRHYDFDYLNEEILQKAKVQDNRLKFFKEDGELSEEFEVLILPRITTLSLATAEKIEEFAKRGGLVIATSRLPDTSVERGGDEVLERRMAGIFANDRCSLVKDASKKRKEEILGRLLAKNLRPDVVIRKNNKPVEEIIYLHYLKDEKDFYYLVNTSETGKKTAEIVLDRAGTMEVWDPLNGETAVCHSKVVDGRINLDLKFEPVQSYLLAVDNGPPVPEADSTGFSGRNPRPAFSIGLKGLWGFSTLKPNALPLKEWQYATAVKITPTSGFPLGVHRYRTVFYVRDVPDSLRVLLDGLLIDRINYACPALRETTEHGIRVSVNGKKIPRWQDGTYLDHYIKEMDISRLVKKGRNVIAVETLSELFEAPNLTDPFILVGNFSLRFKGRRPFLVREKGAVKTGSWAEQGYPYYSGTASYRKSLKIFRSVAGMRVVLRMEGIADMAEVCVNGRDVKVVPWPPYEADITGLLKQGGNELVLKITNSLHNLLAGEKNPSGLLGKVRIDFYGEKKEIIVGEE